MVLCCLSLLRACAQPVGVVTKLPLASAWTAATYTQLQKPFDEQARLLLFPLVASSLICVLGWMLTYNTCSEKIPFIPRVSLMWWLQPDGYTCPQCRAPKKRFAECDVNSRKPIGGGLPPIGVIAGLLTGVAGAVALLVYGLQ